MRTKPYRLAILAFDEMDLLDVAAPLEVFSTAGRKWNWRAIKAELVSSDGADLQTRAQLRIGPSVRFEDCVDPELLLIPGGYGARRALADDVLLSYLRRVGPGLSLTLTVGTGALLAARAGLLQGAELACIPSLEAELRELEPSITLLTQARTSSGPRVISAAQNGSALDLGLEVVAKLLGKGQASGTARELGYAWGTETLAVEILP